MPRCRSAPRRAGIEPLAVIFHVHFHQPVGQPEPHPRALGPGMPGHVVQRFLQHPVHVDARRLIDVERRSIALVTDGDAELALDGGKIPVNRAFEARFFEDRRMEHL